MPTHQSITEDVVPSLTHMSPDIIDHIFDFLANDGDNIPAFLALSQTCRTFNNVLGNDEMWEKLYPDEAAKEFEHETTTKGRVFISRAISNIKNWQNGRRQTDNILLQYLEGADGVNVIIQSFLCDSIGGYIAFYPPGFVMFRGDTVHYMTELIQANI